MPRLRVLVVEDSLTVRKRLCEVLASDPDIEVIGEASDGRQAIAMCQALRPDVLTMDMMLPELSGLEATEYIMAHCPTPILVVSSADNRGEVFRTYDALAAGAVDVLEKPVGDEDDQPWARRLLGTVKMVARIRVITHVRARMQPFSHVGKGAGAGIEAGRHGWPTQSTRSCKLIAIGASTGGPGAIVSVLRELPFPLRVPVVIVQHIDDTFGPSLVAWLNTQTPQETSFAKDGDALSCDKPRVYLAPANRHLIVEKGFLRLVNAPPVHSCRPAVDYLFNAIARDCGGSTIAVLLTGMGRDGAQGLLNIKLAGGHTIAQDESTSVIYGMPREAVKLGAAVQVLPLGEIGPTLATLSTSTQGTGS